MIRSLTMRGMERHADLALLLLRIATGGFLLFQSHDNVLDPARMAEFAKFMGQFGFPAPHILAPFAIFWQVAAGVGFVLGLFTRPLGLIIAIMFVVAVWMVHMNDPANIVWSAASLIAIGFVLGTIGAGRYSIDAAIEGRRR